MMIERRTLLAAAAAVALGAAPAAAGEKWDMALAYSATNYHSEIATQFAADVTEATGGALEIVTHPGGSLFPGNEIYGAVRRGLVPIGERLVSALSNDDPMFEIDAIPFLATSFGDARRLYEAVKPDLVASLDAQGLVFLYSGPWPPQGLYSVREITEPSDLEGLKFRAYNATTAKVAEMLGMIPTTIEAAELQQAFATGVAEAMISSGSTGYDRKLWEHVGYFYDVQGWLPRNMVVVNKEAWEGLDDATRQIIRDAAAAAEERVWAKSEELAGWYVEQFTIEGMQVPEVPASLRARLEEIGAQLLAEWLEKTGERGAAVIAAYRGE